MMPSKSIIAIIAVTILATIGILKGVNSGLLVGAIATIAGLGGYALGKATKPK